MHVLYLAEQKNEAHRKQTEAEDALKALEKPAEEAPEDDQGTDNDNDYEEDEQVPSPATISHFCSGQ